MRSQVIPLLKYEFMRFAWLLPLIYGLFSLEIYRKENGRIKYMDSLDAGGQGTAIFMMLWFGFYVFFLVNGRLATGRQTNTLAGWSVSGLDFFFSRAVDRRAWFVIKTSLFALVVLTPTLLLCLSHQKSASIRIELPYNSTASRATLTTFYIANFDGAHLEKPDTGRNEDYVVVPHGRQDITHFQIVSNVLTLIIFQVLAFLFWPRGWGLGASFIGSFAATIFLSSPSSRVPSHYEEGVAFVANHPGMTAGALILFYLVSQLYCGWRFVRTEFTS
jgi:hypothetical protein